MTGWKRGVAIVIAALWVAVTVDVIRRWQQLAVGDFETYWTGARRLLDGLPLYPPSQLDQPFVLGDAAFGRGFVYPPTAAVFATPLALLPMPVAFLLFTAVSAAALAIVVFAIATRSGASRGESVVIAAVLVATGPGLDALLTGNVNALAAAGLGAMWLRPGASGVLAVVGGLVKVYPGVGLVWAIRRRAPVLVAVLLAVFVVAVSIIVAGAQSWNDFRATMANGLSNEYFPIQSPRSLLWAPLGVIGAGVVAAVITLIAIALSLRIRDARTAFALLGLAMILPAPEWHLHYFIVPVVGFLPLALPLLVRSIAGRSAVPDGRTTQSAVPG